MTHYILDENHNAVPVEDALEWARWFETANESRRVGRDTVGRADISTVFLGLNQNFGRGVPLLYETMVFGGPDDGWQDRYSTWDEAIAGHDAVVGKLRAGERL